MHYNPPLERITVEPDKMGGQPCIRGYRFTVQNLLTYLITYPDRKDLFENFPFLEEEDVQQAIRFAIASLDGFRVPLELAS